MDHHQRTYLQLLKQPVAKKGGRPDRPFFMPHRLLKNAHLLRFPYPSLRQAQGRLVAAYVQARLAPQDFACLREAASAKAGAPCIWAFLSSLRRMIS
jgi:hypothetical protein